MTFLQFLGYFLLADTILSLATFSVLYFFRKDLLFRLSSYVRGVFYRVAKEEAEALEEMLNEDDENGPYPKKAMRDALDRVFGLKGGDDDTTH